ncbi:MAG: metallophosphoesterase [Leptospiraceae bacterium]|nr:metallophosphoesterase [Leptospiraceae bacterium]
MRKLKFILISIVIFLFTTILIKFFYRSNSEKYGFDFKMEAIEIKNYSLIRFFFPATTTGIMDELRKQRKENLFKLKKILEEKPLNKDEIINLKEKLMLIDKKWDENTYFVEKQAKKSYYKKVKAPRFQDGKVNKEDFTVSPYLMYYGNDKRVLRWVGKENFTYNLKITNPSNIAIEIPNSNIYCRQITNKSPNYCESILQTNTKGTWNWEVIINKLGKKKKGSFEIDKTKVIAFYADTQDSLEFHEKSIQYLNKIKEKYKIDLVLHGGDITSWGSNEEELLETARMISKLSIPIAFAIGNHDFKEDYGYSNEALLFNHLFKLHPKDNLSNFANFSIGENEEIQLLLWDTNFVRMSAEDFISQDKFIKNNILSNKPSILTSHHGYMSKGWHGSFLGSHSEVWQRILYHDLFSNNPLLLYLNGHDHVYQRILNKDSKYKMRSITAGPASAQILYPYFNTDGEVESLERKRTITIVEILSNHLKITTLDFEKDEEIDSFELNFEIKD